MDLEIRIEDLGLGTLALQHLQNNCTFAAQVLYCFRKLTRMCCKCSANVLQMFCKCSANVLQMFYKCAVKVTYRHASETANWSSKTFAAQMQHILIDTLSKTFFSIPHFNSGSHHFTLLKWGIHFQHWECNAGITF